MQECKQFIEDWRAAVANWQGWAGHPAAAGRLGTNVCDNSKPPGAPNRLYPPAGRGPEEMELRFLRALPGGHPSRLGARSRVTSGQSNTPTQFVLHPSGHPSQNCLASVNLRATPSTLNYGTRVPRTTRSGRHLVRPRQLYGADTRVLPAVRAIGPIGSCSARQPVRRCTIRRSTRLVGMT